MADQQDPPGTARGVIEAGALDGLEFLIRVPADGPPPQSIRITPDYQVINNETGEVIGHVVVSDPDGAGG